MKITSRSLTSRTTTPTGANPSMPVIALPILFISFLYQLHQSFCSRHQPSVPYSATTCTTETRVVRIRLGVSPFMESRCRTVYYVPHVRTYKRFMYTLNWSLVSRYTFSHPVELVLYPRVWPLTDTLTIPSCGLRSGFRSSVNAIILFLELSIAT